PGFVPHLGKPSGDPVPADGDVTLGSLGVADFHPVRGYGGVGTFPRRQLGAGLGDVAYDVPRFHFPDLLPGELLPGAPGGGVVLRGRAVPWSTHLASGEGTGATAVHPGGALFRAAAAGV